MASIPATRPGDSILLRFPERRSTHRLTVSTEKLADYTSIQDAIDRASAGATIVIDAGVYFENLVIDKPVHLVGPSDPRFAADELDVHDDMPCALVVGTGEVTIEWSAAGGSIRNLAISQVPSGHGSSLLRMDAGRLQVERCVLSDGAQTAVECHGGELTLERCHIRDIEAGVWAMGGSVRMERTHVEGSNIMAVSVESAASIAMIDACLEGRTVLTGEVVAFEGNDLDIVFTSRPVSAGNNRISSLVHLCAFQIVDEVAISL